MILFASLGAAFSVEEGLGKFGIVEIWRCFHLVWANLDRVDGLSEWTGVGMACRLGRGHLVRRPDRISSSFDNVLIREYSYML